jgi:hypothetical protein
LRRIDNAIFWICFWPPLFRVWQDRQILIAFRHLMPRLAMTRRAYAAMGPAFAAYPLKVLGKSVVDTL